jgi:hypothetical protein
MANENAQGPNTQELTRIVARFRTGDVLKGISQDFTNLKPTFHLLPESGGPARVVKLKDLKAVFFVKSLIGNPKRPDIAGFLLAPMETAAGKKICVLFNDGELLCGHTLSWTPEREGFFMVPSDAGSNNLRIYVLSAAAQKIKAGPAAEALAKEILEDRRRRSAA